MLGGAFAAFTISAALMHAYPVYLVAFIEDFGWSRAETSIAYSVSQLVGGVSAPLIGMLVDRLGPRRLLLIGSLLLGISLVASAFVTALWQIVLLYGVVMTFGANCLGLVAFVPLLSRHFVRRRGMAISIVQSANGIARGISAPAVQRSISLIGWRPTYLAQAAVMAAVVLPLAALFRRADPGGGRQAEPRSAPEPPPDPSSASQARAGWSLGEAMHTPHFWLLFSVYMFTGLGSFFVSLHQLAFAVDVGFDKLYAAQVLGIGAFLAVPGIVVTGTLSDYLGREISAVLAYGISILGVVCALFITSPDQHLLLWLHACFFGLTWGARGPAITAKTADLFPGPRLGTILGVITIGSGLGAALGSWGAGWIYDLTGSYRVAFLMSIASYVCGTAAFWALRRPPVRRRPLAGPLDRPGRR
jgi:MFS transporter, OFA family, oxalate/formate antiporter